jgi:hypothetical protein
MQQPIAFAFQFSLGLGGKWGEGVDDERGGFLGGEGSVAVGEVRC